MKIRKFYSDRQTLDEFAKAHKLTMEVHERDIPGLPSYYAKFAGAEVQDGNVLMGVCGDGISPDGAIAHYCLQISGTTLVIDAMSSTRRVIKAPSLIPIWEDDAA